MELAIVIVIVAAALLVLLRPLWRKPSVQATGCGAGCAHCSCAGAGGGMRDGGCSRSERVLRELEVHPPRQRSGDAVGGSNSAAR
ncbi:MAG: FeoB-associated Cys-rich membrane protein [Myxococcota bacterium]|jgi:hypothetical protein|nr:FeoB-associated Cys-rich membrane protein [Myxococcota bacterium]